MALRNQVALPSSNAAPTINPKVPMFLQKLYKIVSDPSTNDVICWSDSGDSFYVHDHERLAKEHLGIWFKHNKFASFVRQLNMYGFHKIPHLQQGALRSDSEAEHSQFAHPDFHRGQEDRLIFIERKKQAASNQKEQQGVVDFPTITTQPTNQPQTDSTTGQTLDIHSVVNGIAAIRRHQANISNELNELKSSNQLLWQESMEARNRHQKQQDTINRIVKFLAGVFGQHAASPGTQETERGPSPHSVVRSSRLMIEDKRRDSAPKVGIVEVQDEESPSAVSRDQSPNPFSIETPGSSTSRAPSVLPSPGLTDMSSFPSNTTSTSFLDTNSNPEFSAPSPIEPTPTSTSPKIHNSVISTQPRLPGPDFFQESGLPSYAPSRSPGIDERLQAALSFMTPGDIQQLFASLSAHASFSSDPVDLNSLQQGAQQNQISSSSSTQTLTPVKAPFEFGPFSPSLPAPHLPQPPTPPQRLENTEGLISFDQPYIEQWKQASDIEKEVNQMNTGIDSLIQELGLDPTVIANAEANQANGAADLDPASLLPATDAPMADSSTSDELFNSFLNTFPSPPNLTAGSAKDGLGEAEFPLDLGLDGSVAQYDGASPASTSATSPAVSTPAATLGPGKNTRSQKRKSDAGTDVAMKLQLPSNSRVKRRKDK